MPTPTTRAAAGPPIRVLVVDNDEGHAEAMAESLGKIGYACDTALSGKAAVERMEKGGYEIVVTDLVMPGGAGGLEVLAEARQRLPEAEVILVTGHGTIESAVEAMRRGAFNYLLKPLDLGQLRAVVDNAARSQHLRRANAELRKRLDEKFGFEGVIGESEAMRSVIERLSRIAPTDATVLIQGDTGCGKELVAQAIHQNSPRKTRPFVALNCGALSENILESELFGHIKGAFTDASHDRVGKFEYADGGTLFLDEVGDMPPATQIKLLRVLESGEITRVGSNEAKKVDVRILSATNRDLEAAIAAGTFREDLYHRLKVVTVRLPRLAERREDIPLLIEHFLKLHSKRHFKKVKSVAPAARRRLLAYEWPGNVRELKNAIESMVVVDLDGVLDLDDLPEQFTGGYGGDDTAAAPITTGGSLAELVGKSMADIEGLFIAETLKVTAGNREEAATMLGIGERTLYRKIKEYGLN
ncbi:sigma-54-dependent transcriptional regulator [Botrimarina mediterranea]|uniref:DNA-binding transcriptional response regulator n=1 Tax=Botrimarina mediterranea TaxID=2528022 RepID=A0A518KB37_9BACT|nr:sigma-54 dependent transcriptional regulator [Botrimarina mediterranea]QDV74988.1 DNA-binding transcriptional response regulator [Botrimarina mediterranea]QDV79635.1 DNA-binding transcriptional response regulator [Planctomycetes bacterium K2D]